MRVQARSRTGGQEADVGLVPNKLPSHQGLGVHGRHRNRTCLEDYFHCQVRGTPSHQVLHSNPSNLVCPAGRLRQPQHTRTIQRSSTSHYYWLSIPACC
ncbi:hypothetical protein VTN31DRAFT_1413 [Thermomyces dupontii]|uniref:uncharacterized protein n=1 Tax=Talaromyces thermophilus TaxID=28565 RepID=UPI003743A23A